MLWLFAEQNSATIRRPELRRSQFAALSLQSGGIGVGYLKERWTEAEILELPQGEHDYFDRKAGRLFDEPNFRETLAKAVSAMANSGGGHIVFGQQDDLAFDGLPTTKGRTNIREHLETVVTNLVNYPLASFRVHLVEPSESTQIPTGKSLVVIDIGDSSLAPHQAIVPSDKPTYYCRMGGRSVHAPHHYLEALRNRFVSATLDVSKPAIQVRKVHLGNRAGEDVVEFEFVFSIKNTGRVACYKWEVSSALDNTPPFLETRNENSVIGRKDNMRIDTTILPTATDRCSHYFGITYRAAEEKRQLLDELLRSTLRYRVIGEHFVGEEQVVLLSETATAEDLLAQWNEKSPVHPTKDRYDR
jgi:hypothetical protein